MPVPWVAVLRALLLIAVLGVAAAFFAPRKGGSGGEKRHIKWGQYQIH